MDALQIGLIILVAIIVVGGIVAWSMNQRRRTERLTERYGPEYQRTVEAAGDQREAERELEAREKRVERLEIRRLSVEERDGYLARWKETQARFVDDPPGAISEADGLVQDVMQARGYPMVDFDQRAADISVDHPHLVEEYRAAHVIAEKDAADGVETEDLRQAMVHYRALFDDLLETDASDSEQELEAGGVR
jgi:hypothetical protein